MGQRPPCVKLFHYFNKDGVPDLGIIGDKWQTKISGSGGNQPVMQLGDVVDLRSGFKNLKAQRLKLLPGFCTQISAMNTLQ